MEHDDSSPRANRHGDKCPEWCTTDHHQPLELPSGRTWYHDVHNSGSIGSHDLFEPYVSLADFGGGAEVWVNAPPHGQVSVPARNERDVESMALLLESLANCEPSVIRALADVVRQAARIGIPAKASESH